MQSARVFFETVRPEWDGLSDADLEKITGGKLYEAAFKGTHIPEVTIECW